MFSVDVRPDIRLDLESICELIGFVEQPNDCKELSVGFVIQPKPLHGGGMGVYSVIAAVRDADCKGHHLLGQRIEFSRSHDLLQFPPHLIQ